MARDHLDERARLLGQIEATVQERLGGAADGGDRRAQLVRGVGDEVAPHLVGPPFRRQIAQDEQRPRVRERGHLSLDLESERGQRQLALVRPAGETAGAEVDQLVGAGSLEHRWRAAEQLLHPRIARHDASADLQQRGGAGHGLEQFLQPGRLAPTGDERLAPPQLVDQRLRRAPFAQLGADQLDRFFQRRLAAEELHPRSGSDIR